MKFNFDTIKNGLITTAVVLACIYGLRRTDAGKKLVNTALAG